MSRSPRILELCAPRHSEASARAICVLLANCRSKVTYFEERKRTTYLEMPGSPSRGLEGAPTRTSSARSSRFFSPFVACASPPVVLPFSTATISSLPAYLVLLFRLRLGFFVFFLSLSLSLCLFSSQVPLSSANLDEKAWFSMNFPLPPPSHPPEIIGADKVTPSPWNSSWPLHRSSVRDTLTAPLARHLSFSSIHCHPVTSSLSRLTFSRGAGSPRN